MPHDLGSASPDNHIFDHMLNSKARLMHTKSSLAGLTGSLAGLAGGIDLCPGQAGNNFEALMRLAEELPFRGASHIDIPLEGRSVHGSQPMHGSQPWDGLATSTIKVT